MTALDKLLAKGVAGIRAAVARARARVVALAHRRRYLAAEELMALARRELQRSEPLIARAIETGVLAAWLASARGTADTAGLTAPASNGELTPPDPFGPFAPLPFAPGAFLARSRPVTRHPAIEAAVRDLRARRALPAADFDALAEDARSAAFTVARVATESAVDAVRGAVARTVEHGVSLARFRAAVADALDESGLSPANIETVYRTQTGLAHSAGLRAVLEHPLVGDEFPYVAWHATHDGRVRPDHLAMERAGIGGGNVFRCDDPALREVWPPCAWNCRCVCVPVSLEDAAEAGVREAQLWIRTGAPPAKPAWVGSVPVKLPKGWPIPSGGRVRAA